MLILSVVFRKLVKCFKNVGMVSAVKESHTSTFTGYGICFFFQPHKWESLK